jgi:hypothetical protein
MRGTTPGAWEESKTRYKRENGMYTSVRKVRNDLASGLGLTGPTSSAIIRQSEACEPARSPIDESESQFDPSITDGSQVQRLFSVGDARMLRRVQIPFESTNSTPLYAGSHTTDMTALAPDNFQRPLN